MLPSKENNNNHDNDDHDTIFALSSGSSGQATTVVAVRISGPRAPHILQCLLSSSRDNNDKNNNNQPAFPVPHRATLHNLYAPLIDENNNNDSQQQQQQHQLLQPLDQALVLYFAAPHSFTSESVVELHCHSSRAMLQGLSEALLVLGACYAEAGEFTSRTWQNGKLVDMLQVEVLGDLLQADTAMQRVQALRQLSSHWSVMLANWRQQLIAGLAHAEAVIDFGDDENLNSDIDTTDTDIDTTDNNNKKNHLCGVEWWSKWMTCVRPCNGNCAMPDVVNWSARVCGLPLWDHPMPASHRCSTCWRNATRPLCH